MLRPRRASVPTGSAVQMCRLGPTRRARIVHGTGQKAIAVLIGPAPPERWRREHEERSTMPEKRTEGPAPAEGKDAPDLATLAQQLRERAAAMPPHRRDEAVSAAESVHAYAISDNPDVHQMTPHLRRLEAFAELAPTVNAILQAMSNVGL
jgi:hypothetical protein